MGFLAHAQTVDTRPLFPPPTWPGYEATFNYEGRESLVQVPFRMSVTSWVELYMGGRVKNNNTSKVPGNLFLAKR